MDGPIAWVSLVGFLYEWPVPENSAYWSLYPTKGPNLWDQTAMGGGREAAPPSHPRLDDREHLLAGAQQAVVQERGSFFAFSVGNEPGQANVSLNVLSMQGGVTRDDE